MNKPSKRRFAIIGCGFWSKFQLSGWRELNGTECIGVYDRNAGKARELAGRFNIPKVYPSIEAVYNDPDVDFVDIITTVDSHHDLVVKAARKGIDVVCQKPMASSYKMAWEMVEACKKNQVVFLVNENFRWQAPVRKIKRILNAGITGRLYKARVSFRSGFKVFRNQPFLSNTRNFIISDMGSHVLDVCRFLFGEADSIYCLTHKIDSSIIGEDVADIMLKMKNGMSCIIELSYASVLEKELFPQTLMLIEGEKACIHLGKNLEIQVVTRTATTRETVKLKEYPWFEREYALIQSGILDTQQNILEGLKGGNAETTGEDNLKTMALVWAAYESAENEKVIKLEEYNKNNKFVT